MIPASVLLLLVKSTIVLVAALGITRALRRGPAGARHVVWLATLGALLLVPALATWTPLHIAVLPAAPERSAAPSTQTVPVSAAIARATPATRDAASTASPAGRDAGLAEAAAGAPAAFDVATSAGRRVMDVVPVVLALWAAVALVIGASLAQAWLAVRRIVRRARPLDTREWRDPLWEIADRLGLDEPPRLLRSADAKMPFACGVARPTIVLPAESDEWTLDRRRAVLLHELAHVRRRDLAGHTFARVMCALYWFHPLVWTAAKRLRAESERACDDLALACGARPADYAEHLLDIVTSARGDATPLVALAMARRTEFEGRLLEILDPERPRATPSRRQAASLVGVLALIAVVVGAAAPARVPAAARDVAAGTAPAPREAPAELPREIARPGESPATPVSSRAVAGGAAIAQRTPERAGNASAVPDAVVEHTVGAPPSVPSNGDTASAPALRDLVERVASASPGQSDDERPELLAKVLRADTSASLRRIAAWGLAEYAELPSASTALAAALRGDRNVAVREMAAWALAESHGNEVALDALGQALRADADVKVRATAAWALGNVGGRSSAEVLAAALSDSSARVRARALWALGNVTPRQAPRALVAMLGDGDAEARKLTAWALFNIQDPSAIPALQAALRSEKDADLQVAYIRALAALGEKSVDALRGLLDSPDARIRSIAVRALAGGNATGPWPWPVPQPRPFP